MNGLDQAGREEEELEIDHPHLEGQGLGGEVYPPLLGDPVLGEDLRLMRRWEERVWRWMGGRKRQLR